MAESYKQNKMGVMPVGRLVVNMGLPMILSMVIQAVYNIVDSYFVSGIGSVTGDPLMGDYAVNALTLAFPVQILMIAIGVGTGIGVNAILSKTLGQGNREKAAVICGNTIFIGICVYLLFLFFGKTGVDFYLGTQTGNEVVLEMARDYLVICTEFSFGVILFMLYEKLLQATGKTTQSMIIQIAGAVINIILDPLLIFGCGFIPAMGIKGAAYATVIGQICSFLAGLVLHKIYNSREFNTGVRYVRPDISVIREIYRIGFPAVIMQALTSVMTYGINIIFGHVSLELVTAYGVYYKIQQFIFFMAAGMNNALIPILAFNFGARNRERIRESIHYGMKYTVILMIAGTVVLEIFAKQFIGLFELTESARILCVTAIRIGVFTYTLTGINVIFQGILQALGEGMRSMTVAIIRMVLVAFPAAWLFTLTSVPEITVWLTFPAGELAGLSLALYYYRKTKIKKLAEL